MKILINLSSFNFRVQTILVFLVCFFVAVEAIKPDPDSVENAIRNQIAKVSPNEAAPKKQKLIKCALNKYKHDSKLSSYKDFDLNDWSEIAVRSCNGSLSSNATAAAASSSLIKSEKLAINETGNSTKTTIQPFDDSDETTTTEPIEETPSTTESATQTPSTSTSTTTIKTSSASPNTTLVPANKTSASSTTTLRTTLPTIPEIPSTTSKITTQKPTTAPPSSKNAGGKFEVNAVLLLAVVLVVSKF